MAALRRDLLLPTLGIKNMSVEVYIYQSIQPTDGRDSSRFQNVFERRLYGRLRSYDFDRRDNTNAKVPPPVAGVKQVCSSWDLALTGDWLLGLLELGACWGCRANLPDSVPGSVGVIDLLSTDPLVDSLVSLRCVTSSLLTSANGDIEATRYPVLRMAPFCSNNFPALVIACMVSGLRAEECREFLDDHDLCAPCVYSS